MKFGTEILCDWLHFEFAFVRMGWDQFGRLLKSMCNWKSLGLAANAKLTSDTHTHTMAKHIILDFSAVISLCDTRRRRHPFHFAKCVHRARGALARVRSKKDASEFASLNRFIDLWLSPHFDIGFTIRHSLWCGAFHLVAHHMHKTDRIIQQNEMIHHSTHH